MTKSHNLGHGWIAIHYLGEGVAADGEALVLRHYESGQRIELCKASLDTLRRILKEAAK